MKVFKDIEWCKGNYRVSNYGEVYSVKRGIILKPTICCDYEKVNLYYKGKMKTFSVHRLMMEAFIPNPENLPCINHKDENKRNNFIWVNDDGTVDLEKSNLEWCTVGYNNAYGTRGKRISESLSGENSYMYGKHHSDEVKEKISKSLKGRVSPNKGKKASEETKTKQSIAHSNISEETRNKFRDNYNRRKKDLINAASKAHYRKVMQFDLDGNLIKVWDSIKSAANELNLKSPNIIACCNNKQKTCGKYEWRYE